MSVFISDKYTAKLLRPIFFDQNNPNWSEY